VPAEPGIDWRHAARLTRDKTPADLRQMAEDAASLALGAGREAISAGDVVTAIRRDGRVEPEPAAAGEVRHRMAIHESGHCCVAVALRGAGWLYATRLGVNEGRTSVSDESVPDAMRPDDERRDAMTVAFGGIAAERAVLGEGSTGGTSDVSRASAIGLERIAAGLSDETTPIDLDLLGRNVSEGLKDELAADLAAQLEAARGIAAAIVGVNVDAIGRFAAILEVAGELTGDALAAAVQEARFRIDAGAINRWPGRP
jgi:ATP-dependent Zn protease